MFLLSLVRSHFFLCFVRSLIFLNKAKSLIQLKSILDETSFANAKKQILERVRTADDLANLFELGFVERKDFEEIRTRVTAQQKQKQQPPVLQSGLDVTTALCLVIDCKSDEISSVRSKFDKAAKRWPPHINLFFPFVPVADFSSVAARLQNILWNFGSFDLLLDNPSFFSQGKGQVTFNLQPGDDAKLQVGASIGFSIGFSIYFLFTGTVSRRFQSPSRGRSCRETKAVSPSHDTGPMPAEGFGLHACYGEAADLSSFSAHFNVEDDCQIQR